MLLASVVPSVMRKNADGSVFPSAIAQLFLRDLVRDGAHLHVRQSNLRGQKNGCSSRNDSGAIADGKTDPSAFLRITDGTTNAKSTRGKNPFTVVVHLYNFTIFVSGLPSVTPFDATLEIDISDQKTMSLYTIQQHLRQRKASHALAMLRASREVWPENDVFGEEDAEAEDEFIILREILFAEMERPAGMPEQRQTQDEVSLTTFELFALQCILIGMESHNKYNVVFDILNTKFPKKLKHLVSTKAGEFSSQCTALSEGSLSCSSA
jgi:hypothetical protein